MSRTGNKTEFLEIDAVTNSKVGNIAKAIGVGATGGAAATLASPFTAVVTGVVAGVGAGVAAADRTEDKGKAAELAAGTAAGIGGGVAGVALGLLATPFVLVASPFVGTAKGITKRMDSQKDVLDKYLKEYPDDSEDQDLK